MMQSAALWLGEFTARLTGYRYKFLPRKPSLRDMRSKRFAATTSSVALSAAKTLFL